ncbi:MAG: AAA family ATPase [Candidatus Bilamarchaeum sp.]
MKTTYFITGVSGVGKTTTIEHLKAKLPFGYEIHDFDERGVPDGADRQWRINETEHWIELGAKNAEQNITTIICGFARPSEIGHHESVGFVLLDATPETIRKRLWNRYQTPRSIEGIERVANKSVDEFIEDSVNFSSVMHDEAQNYGVDIIDTNELSPDQVADKIVEILDSNSV